MLWILAQLGATGVAFSARGAVATGHRGVVARPARSSALVMGECVVVTDGTDSFYASRTVFQSLFDFGDFEKITALGSSIVESKKMLISRQARYSGLIDILEFAEGAATEGMAGATTWVGLNTKPSTVADQIAAAKAAGVTRAFVHLSSDDPEDATLDAAALEAALGGSGLTYTLLRTGKLAEKGAGGGIKLSELDTPVCEDVPKDDIFRFITEALTIPEASGRSFSLCPSVDDSQLKAMRMAGCSRREEVEALLAGKITETLAEAAAAEEEAAPEEAASKAEEAASREEELQMLLKRAKDKGIENQKRMKEEEVAKAALREERNMYFKSVGDDDKKDGEGGGDAEEPPPPEEEEPPKKDDDDDGLALA